MATTQLTIQEIEKLAAEYAGLPVSYFNYMRDIGWGSAANGHMIYSAPIAPSEVYPQLSDESDCVLIGDDMQGYCLAYHFGHKTYGEFSDDGIWSSFNGDFDLFAYLAGRER